MILYYNTNGYLNIRKRNTQHGLFFHFVQDVVPVSYTTGDGSSGLVETPGTVLHGFFTRKTVPCGFLQIQRLLDLLRVELVFVQEGCDQAVHAGPVVADQVHGRYSLDAGSFARPLYYIITVQFFVFNLLEGIFQPGSWWVSILHCCFSYLITTRILWNSQSSLPFTVICLQIPAKSTLTCLPEMPTGTSSAKVQVSGSSFPSPQR